MQKLYLVRPTRSDVRDQRYRFLTGPSAKITTLATPFPVEDDLYYALPRATSGNIALPSRSPVVLGSYPPTGEVERLLADYAAAARRCDCGALREYTLQRCHACTLAILDARASSRKGLMGDDVYYSGRQRPAEARENVHETKYGVDR